MFKINFDEKMACCKQFSKGFQRFSFQTIKAMKCSCLVTTGARISWDYSTMHGVPLVTKYLNGKISSKKLKNVINNILLVQRYKITM